eukprot:3947765-Amphidinium_carterae.1
MQYILVPGSCPPLQVATNTVAKGTSNSISQRWVFTVPSAITPGIAKTSTSMRYGTGLSAQTTARARI